jgi:hypothetical protein
MVKAHELESTVSIYPRIAVSRKIYSQMKGSPLGLLLEVHDGITHFNYFRRMIFHGQAAAVSPEADLKESVNVWMAEARQTIAGNVDNFEQRERWNEQAKWVWFRNQLEQAWVSYSSAQSS